MIACGRAGVVGLGDMDADTTDALPEKDAAIDTGTADSGTVDTGTVADAGLAYTGTVADTGVIDSGEESPDRIDPEDTGELPDAEPDTGIDEDGGMIGDAGNNQCASDMDCGFNQHCDPATLTCVQCYEDMHCAGQLVCDQTHGNVCRLPCFNGQCGPLGVCEPNENVCVACQQDTDCGAGEVCNPTTLECVECSTDADCALKPGRTLCDEPTGECRGCIDDTDCPAGEECNPLSDGVCVPPTNRGLCAPCATDDQCGGPADLCIGILLTGGLIDRTCSTDCSADPTVCPSGFECIPVRNGELVCRPSYDMQTPTCEATRNLGAACQLDPADVDPGCGIDGAQDARCESIVAGGAGQCVVWCVDDADCANGTTCQPGTQGVDVCR
jgi:Cys-rich repeat protein